MTEFSVRPFHAISVVLTAQPPPSVRGDAPRTKGVVGKRADPREACYWSEGRPPRGMLMECTQAVIKPTYAVTEFIVSAGKLSSSQQWDPTTTTEH
jgi:hypothetical protein